MIFKKETIPQTTNKGSALPPRETLSSLFPLRKSRKEVTINQTQQLTEKIPTED